MEKQIVYFFFALKRDAMISCFKSKCKSKRMDGSDEVLIFKRLETIRTIYCTLLRLTSYNLIYSHKYTKITLEKAHVRKRANDSCIRVNANDKCAEHTMHSTLSHCTAHTNKCAHYVWIVWEKRHEKNVFHKFCMFLKFSPRKNSSICTWTWIVCSGHPNAFWWS